MKIYVFSRMLCAISLLLFSLKSKGQASTDELLAKVWQFKMATSLNETNQLGILVSPANSDVAARNFQFRVVNILNNGDLVIKFLYWHVETVTNNHVVGFSATATASPNALLNERFYMQGFLTNYFTGNRASFFRYFIISRSDFDLRCEEKLPKRQFTVGAMTLPIKMRFEQKLDDGTNKSYSSFTGNVSVGLSFGLKRNINKSFALNFLGGFSLSSIPVTAETTNNFVESETNQAALTWHAGILAEINNFQIGIFTGVDYLSGKINKEWDYKNRPWLGVGIGFSFFNAKKTTDSQ